MKKVILFVSAILLSTGLMFAQTPQNQEKTKKATKTETKTEVKKDAKVEKSAPTKKTGTMEKKEAGKQEIKSPEKK